MFRGYKKGVVMLFLRKLLFLSFLTFSAARAAEIPLTIAMIYPATDPHFLTGVEAAEGAKMAFEEKRAEFKRLGYDLRIKVYDDKRSPAKGQHIAREIVNDSSTVVVWGPINSSVTLAVSETLAPANIGLVSSKSTNPLITERGLANVNRIVPRDDAQGSAAVNFLEKKLGVSTVVVLDDTSTYGKGLFNQFRKSIRETKIKVLEYFSRKSNFSEVIDVLKKEKPQAFYYAGSQDVGIGLVKAIRAANLNIPIIGGDGIDNEQFRSGAGRAAIGVYNTGVAAPPIGYPKADGFVKRFKIIYQKTPGANHILGYDAMRVILQSLKDIVTLEPGRVPSRVTVMKALRNVKAVGLAGDLQFNSAGDRLNAEIFILKASEDLTSQVVGSFTAVLRKK
jgi:branched-chain amino acid transport system substrate-binding protein